MRNDIDVHHGTDGRKGSSNIRLISSLDFSGLGEFWRAVTKKLPEATYGM